MNTQKEAFEEKLVNLKDLKWIFRALLKGWYWLILIPLIVGGIGAFSAYKKTPQYTSQMQILLKSNEVYDYQSSIYQSVGFLYTDISNQIRVLKSYDMIEKVVKKLDLNVSYFIAGRINTVETFHGVPFTINLTSFDNSLQGQRIKFKIINAKEFELSFDINDEIIKEIHSFGKEILSKYFIATVHKIASVGNNIANYEIEFHNDSYWIKRIASSLQITNQEYTSILNLTLIDEIPLRSQMFLDTLAKVYIDYTLQSQFDINENTMVYINKQLGDVTIMMDSIVSEMDTIRDEKDILDLGKETGVLFNRLFSLQSGSLKIKKNITSLTHLKTYVENSGDENLLPPSMYVVNNDPFLTKTLTSFYSSQLSINAMKTDVKEGHLKLQNLKEEISLQRLDLLSYIANSIEAYELEYIDNEKELSKTEAILKKTPKTNREVKDVERTLQVNEKLYMFLLEKRANTFIAKSGIIPRTKVIEKPRVIDFIGGDYLKKGVLFSSFGVVLGAILSIFLYWLFHKYNNVIELKEATKLPIFGSLPFEKGVEGLQVDTGSKSNLMESLRGIRTSLSYTLGKENKTFLVTSIHPGEGKTFVSGSLAYLYSKSGKKVLIIDFDLHKPRMHKFFNVENTKGNSNYLAGQLEIESVIKPFADNIDIISSGPVPPNPSELILEEKVNELIKYGQENYDYVFLDTPPIGLISDGVVLMSKVDVSVFVMNTKMANKKGIQYLEEIVNDVNIKHKGIVLNGVKVKKWKYYYGKYGYGYGYGYGNSYSNS